MIMSAPIAPPPALSEDAIRRLLVERVDERRLSVGMVVGITEATGQLLQRTFLISSVRLN
jgi:hypothetical protein